MRPRVNQRLAVLCCQLSYQAVARLSVLVGVYTSGATGTVADWCLHLPFLSVDAAAREPRWALLRFSFNESISTASVFSHILMYPERGGLLLKGAGCNWYAKVIIPDFENILISQR